MMTTLPYTYEFDQSDLQGIKHCKEQHGFAIVKGLLPQETVERLKADVRHILGPRFTDESIRSITDVSFIERSSALTELLTYEPFMKIVRHLHDEKPITLNRSAAIYKNPGSAAGVQHSGAMAWHTDWQPLEHPYKANAVLNNTGAFSCWFYLTGSQPHNGGLSIIPDSHTDDWSGPAGFEFTKDRHSFYRKGTEEKAYTGMDVPGMMPVVSDPGDLVIFAERTYHGVHPHQGEAPRLSCAVSFRTKSYTIGQCWPLPESAKKFIETSPQEIRHLLEGYTGFDGSWVSEKSRQ